VFQAARPIGYRTVLPPEGRLLVAVLGSANCSACSGSIRPEPKFSSRSPGPSRLALVVRMRRMSAGVSFGLRCSSASASNSCLNFWYETKLGRRFPQAANSIPESGTKILRHCSVVRRTRVQSPASGIPPSITCHPNHSHSSFRRLLSSCRMTTRPDLVSLARNAVSCGSRWI
jgi:hypothetical protein